MAVKKDDVQSELDALKAENARLREAAGGFKKKAEYPKFVYHKDKPTEGRLVKSAEAHAALGEDYKESPAEFGVETHPEGK